MLGWLKRRRRDERRGFLARLRGDVRGNTLAMMAAMMIPMCALAGSAIDVARLYVVKVRLQQACDAGVLAGRKFMADSTSTTLDTNAATQAGNFFANNFRSGWMTTTATTFTPTKTSDSQVAATATATLPMSLMKMFGFAPQTLSVTCKARFDVADTDIMFVLDTTGSMSCLPQDSDATCSAYVNAAGTNSYTRPNDSYAVPGYAGSTAYSVPEKSGSRISALRAAVLNFYDTFAANADASTHVRYGFVTYTSSVNAGDAITDLNPAFLIGSGGSGDKPYYQTRHVYADYVISTSDSGNNGKTQGNCTASTRTPSAALTYNTSTSTATKVYDVWTKLSSGSSTYVCKTRTDTLGPQWEYLKYPLDISPLISGSTTMTDPTKVNGAVLKWFGCVSTTVDNPGQTSFSTTNLPSELNPDLAPTGSLRWWPHLQNVEYVRNGSYTNGATDYSNGDDNSQNPSYGNANMAQSGAVACGKPVRRLTTWTRSDVSNLVNAADFVPIGGTYHDTGMIWGTRLIAPAGPWAADTAAWAGRNPPNRVIVFMTDGDMAPTTSSYSMYGEEGYDRQVLGSAGTSNLTDYHNNRFLAACAAAKARNIDVWTVSIDTSASAPLQQCATTTAQALYSTSGTGLSAAFASIAQHLAMLRITQ